MFSPAKVPDMQLMSVAAREEGLWIQPVFDFVRSAPFAGNQRVMSEMPPEIISQFLGTAIDFPTAQNVEVEMIKNENPARTVSVGSPQSADVDTLRPAMDRVRTRVAGAGENL